MNRKLDELWTCLAAGSPLRGSTSELCAVGLAAERQDLLPPPYDSVADAWRRLNDGQRIWVKDKNPRWAAQVADWAEDHGSVAWH